MSEKLYVVNCTRKHFKFNYRFMKQDLQDGMDTRSYFIDIPSGQQVEVSPKIPKENVVKFVRLLEQAGIYHISEGLPNGARPTGRYFRFDRPITEDEILEKNSSVLEAQKEIALEGVSKLAEASAVMADKDLEIEIESPPELNLDSEGRPSAHQNNKNDSTTLVVNASRHGGVETKKKKNKK